MHKQAKEIIERRVDNLIDEFDFDIRKETHLEECPCYQKNKKCHNLENLNCLFCFCPHYDLSIKEGKCRINSPDAKYIDNHEGKILDCSDCDFPHKLENIKDILLKVYNSD